MGSEKQSAKVPPSDGGVDLPAEITKEDYEKAMVAWKGGDDEITFSDKGLRGAVIHPSTFLLGGCMFLRLYTPTALFGGMLLGRLLTYKRVKKARNLMELSTYRDKKFLT